MTSQEMIDQFDLLYNNITSNQAPGLDNYEKSVFLTMAQEEIVKSYFDPRLNKTQQGFDGSERRQIDFSMLITTYNTTRFDGDPEGSLYLTDASQKGKGIVDWSRTTHPILMIINEEVLVKRTSPNLIPHKRLVTVPLSYTEYARLASKPYARPLTNQAWRIIMDGQNSQILIVAGPNDTLLEYSMRYIKKPYPIILENLTNTGVSIDDKVLPYKDNAEYRTTYVYKPKYTEELIDSNHPEQGYKQAVDEEGKPIFILTDTQVKESKSSCELDPILHMEIVQRAVELAKSAYAGDIQTNLALGTSSHTPIGMVSSGGGNQRGE